MAPPPFPCASTELDYPLYAVDFDPEDSNRLIVGGGGGAGRSGVGNKITVIETVSKHELRVSGEINLSRDEDSVMSLAIGANKGKVTHLYAGVNSSPDSIAKGKNEHLRTLAIEKTKARASVGTKTADTNISEMSRSALFSNPDADTYQRLLRVAGQTGAAATAMGKEPQLAVFDAASATPKLTGVLELPKEAEDLDIIQTGEKEYQIAFCYKYELHVVNIGKENSDPHQVFTIPDDDPRRPAFRSIRYISPRFILAAANLPKRSGVVLFGFRLPEKLGKDQARVSASAKIPRNISATALAVSNLSPPASPGAPLGQTQFVVAVAGHDSSISLFTLEHKTGTTFDLLADLWPFYTLKDVHGNDNITGLTFSTFVSPKTHIRQQHIKLASISLQKTVVVHSIPLRKYIDKGPRNKNGPPRPVRYVVAMKSRGPSSRGLVIAISVMVLLMAIIGQSVCEYYGIRPPLLHVDKVLPSRYGTLRTPENKPSVFFADELLSSLGGGESIETQAGEKIVIYESLPDALTGDGAPEGENVVQKIQADVHDSAVHGPGKTWDELGEKQKEAWKARLKDAGAWTQNMGESVFKGILFGEIAGAVGRAVAN
ncbi:hypothetical protein B0T10DRAFT_178569 [Thelonectria olida]|uniref:Guanine nucleotide-exchange factor SEC12 n=1 Tax=Thelonectria olida TaxID=1576542 RepID=A0A9P8WEN5_9HYPO|nr:hypothetical protein B0T10DRAFT_178569 [Thelonectria olida]